MNAAAGMLTPPKLADAVIALPAPTFIAATANAPVPLLPGIVTIPSLLTVAASATMSATGVLYADSSNVLIPTSGVTGTVFVPANRNATSVCPKVVVGSARLRTSALAPPRCSPRCPSAP